MSLRFFALELSELAMSFLDVVGWLHSKLKRVANFPNFSMVKSWVFHRFTTTRWGKADVAIHHLSAGKLAMVTIFWSMGWMLRESWAHKFAKICRIWMDLKPSILAMLCEKPFWSQNQYRVIVHWHAQVQFLKQNNIKTLGVSFSDCHLPHQNPIDVCPLSGALYWTYGTRIFPVEQMMFPQVKTHWCPKESGKH